MRILTAGCRLLSASVLSLLTIPKPAAAVMPPSTCLQSSEEATVQAETDLKRQILEQLRKNDQRLEEIQQEDRVLAARLENLPTRSTTTEPRS